MFWCYSFLTFLLLLGDTYGGMSKSRVRRQDSSAQSRQLIDSIFNIPITAIRQTASAVQIISPENTQRIDSIVKIPVSTLQAVGTFIKTTRERGQQIPNNIQARQERRERILALKEQKRKRKEEIQNQRLQQQLKRTVRHHQKDPLGLDALSNLLVGHHAGGLLGHHSGLGGIHRPHRPGHKIGHGLHKPGIHHGIHGGHLENHPQHTYEVHEDINEDTSFSWHGLTAGFGTFTGIRPSSTSIKIENKVAPKENIKNKLAQEYDDPLENKIAPRNRRVIFVQ
ncbi:hypothetical protein ALC56_10219 [Trachymyrmex septentrionalis]|uniref:Uncharacterized protein n=1 Tax=Trachymyrmex septentrionalis TaxID=34720 RepID=A0A195F5N4_9HYME|nr:PREDICTED: uncharacterized protein LOC108751817 [Trachymyrmex septentrionalis]KYN35384.1 hypothetical protein ALC56_10219 [Trachymyrmex septentrionalis]